MVRAVVQSAYGEPERVLAVRDVPRPEPAPDEVLVRMRAASVHPDVWHVVVGRPRVLRLMGSGLREPTPAIPGTDLAGVVETVGAEVTRFAPGDEVFGETIRGIEWRNGGAYAELVAAPEAGLQPKPANVTFEQAATVPTAGRIALLNLPDLRERPAGQRVLVNGAGGGVGSMALQLARGAGAHITAVDHGDKRALLEQLGADRVIDYTRVDVTADDGGPYDVVFDVVGNHPYGAYRRLLAPDGTYVLIGHDGFGAAGRGWLGSIPTMFGLMTRSLVDPRLPRPGPAPVDRRGAMERLREELETGTLTPVVDRTFPLEEVTAALAHLATGRPLGRVVLVP
jgi:NADPH:quinone reductase-like Zn-dependent oxidoreductase